jgi:hypothetical protein
MPPQDIAQIFVGEDGEFRYHVRAANGEIIASGEGYKNPADIEEMIGRHFPYASIVRLDLTEAE